MGSPKKLAHLYTNIRFVTFFIRFSKMPCCCASNIKAAFVIGIVLAVLYALNVAISFYGTNIFSIITGVLGLVTASILAYGAHTRNAKAVLIYIGSAILIIILFIVETVLQIVAVQACNDFQDGAVGKGVVVFAVVYAVGVIIFDIWTIIVAK